MCQNASIAIIPSIKQEFVLKRFIEGDDRTQRILFPASLDEYIDDENMVHVIVDLHRAYGDLDPFNKLAFCRGASPNAANCDIATESQGNRLCSFMAEYDRKGRARIRFGTENRLKTGVPSKILPARQLTDA